MAPAGNAVNSQPSTVNYLMEASSTFALDFISDALATCLLLFTT
jgi:hypothetical protein